MLKTPTRLLFAFSALALVLASCEEAQMESNDAELLQAAAAAETPASTKYALQNRPDVRGRIGAVSAGNTVVLKPSEYSKNTSILLKKIINEEVTEEDHKARIQKLKNHTSGSALHFNLNAGTCLLYTYDADD